MTSEDDVTFEATCVCYFHIAVMQTTGRHNLREGTLVLDHVLGAGGVQSILGKKT